MGEKDITQKNFEAYNDVVADIVNGSLFDGEEIIKADSGKKWNKTLVQEFISLIEHDIV